MLLTFVELWTDSTQYRHLTYFVCAFRCQQFSIAILPCCVRFAKRTWTRINLRCCGFLCSCNSTISRCIAYFPTFRPVSEQVHTTFRPVAEQFHTVSTSLSPVSEQFQNSFITVSEGFHQFQSSFRTVS